MSASTSTTTSAITSSVARAQRTKAVPETKKKQSRADMWIEENNDTIVAVFYELQDSLSGDVKKEGKHDLYNFAQVVCECFNPHLPRILHDDSTDEEEDEANFAGDDLCDEDREDLLEKDEDIEGEDLGDDVDAQVAEAAAMAAEDEDADDDFEVDDEEDDDDDDDDEGEDDE